MVYDINFEKSAYSGILETNGKIFRTIQFFCFSFDPSSLIEQRMLDNKHSSQYHPVVITYYIFIVWYFKIA